MSADHRLGIGLTVTQGLIAIVMIVCLRVLNSGFSAPGPAAPPIVSQPPTDLPVLPSGAVFGQAMRLNTFAGTIRQQLDAQGREEPTLDVWLNWEVVGPVAHSYDLAILPVAPDGQVSAAGTVLAPFRDRYPMTCWNPALGELHDQIEVPLFKSQPGDWWVSFSLIDANTGQTVEVIPPEGQPDHQIGLGPFR